MVRTKLILAILAAVISVGGTGLWLLISEREDAESGGAKVGHGSGGIMLLRAE